MARPSKDGKYFNCYLDSKIYDQLETLSNLVDMKKTSIVEDALSSYISMFVNKDGNIQGIDAIYKDGDTAFNRVLSKKGIKHPNIIKRKCIVLDEELMYGELYSKIYINGLILSVPSKQIEYAE